MNEKQQSKNDSIMIIHEEESKREKIGFNQCIF